MNQCNLDGNLGGDPQVFTFDNGDKKTSFSLAVPDNYKDSSDNWIDRVQWANIEATGYQAEKIAKWKIGWTVRVCGKFRNVTYQHQGQTKYKVIFSVVDSELIKKTEAF